MLYVLYTCTCTCTVARGCQNYFSRYMSYILPESTLGAISIDLPHPAMSDSASHPTLLPNVHVYTKYVPPTEPALPPLALQVTQLVGSYMIWVGATEEPAEKVEYAPLRGALTRDWVCAMPPTSVCPSPCSLVSRKSDCVLVLPKASPGVSGAATTLHRSSSSDVSYSMAQRLGEACPV